MEKQYKVVNGTYYDERTSDELIKVLEECRKKGTLVQVYLGEPSTGVDWHEENDTIGQIGRSTGPIKIPLLVPKGEMGGGGLLEHCIVKVKEKKTGKVLYQVANYQAPVVEIVPSDMEGYTHNTIINGGLYGRHKSLKAAEKLKAHML